MVTFIIGLAILFVGAALYGKFCERVFGPDDRKTPAYTKQDGIDYVPMRGWKNSLINLLNIAGQSRVFCLDLLLLLRFRSEISLVELCMIIFPV